MPLIFLRELGYKGNCTRVNVRHLFRFRNRPVSPTAVSTLGADMDVTKILADLRQEREQIEQAILSLEMLARGRGRKRGRPPAWMSEMHRQGTQAPRPSRGQQEQDQHRRRRRVIAGAQVHRRRLGAAAHYNVAMGPFMVLLMATGIPDLSQLERMIARFAPTELRADTSALSAGDRKALAKLIEASRAIDDLFLNQIWSGNHALHAQLEKDTTPLGRARLHYFRINKSPWSDLDAHAAFLPGVPDRKPPGANFYPPDMTQGAIRGLGEGPARGGPPGGGRFLHGDPRQRGSTEGGALQPGVPRRSGARGAVAARGGRPHRQCLPAEVPHLAGRCVSLQRLLRERPRLDGPGRPARHHHRPLRDL